MGKLFGTDGIRGVANETLTVPLAYRVGQAAAISLARAEGTKPMVVIGKDTRISSDMLESALIAGLTACGCDVTVLGVIPTPGVAYLTVMLHADAGVVISASHNPFEHNGIKMFSGEGFKLNDALEEEIERLILQDGELPVKTHDALGRVTDGRHYLSQYLDHLASTVTELAPLRVLFDCANGASSVTAKALFGRFALRADYMNVAPDGLGNIPPAVEKNLTAVGDWLKVNGEAVYGTDNGDITEFLTHGRQTARGSTLYLIIRFWEGRESLRVNDLLSRVEHVTLLSTGQNLPLEQSESDLIIHGLPSEKPCPLFPVIRVECAEPLRTNEWGLNRNWCGDPQRIADWARTRGETVMAGK